MAIMHVIEFVGMQIIVHNYLNAYTINGMEMKLIWDEDKRIANLEKHGLNFCDAGAVLESRYRLDITVTRGSEIRTQSLSYVTTCLYVLSVVHTDRNGIARIISYRPASEQETEIYYEWIGSEQNDT